MATIAALITQAQARFNDPDNDLVSDAQWLAYMNQSYRVVNGDSPLWPWLESAQQTVTFSANNNVATLVTNALAVNWVYDVTHDHRLIPQMGKGDQYHTFLDVESTSDVPVSYQVHSNQLLLWPKNSIAIDVKYEAVLFPGDASTNPADTTTVLPWPSAFHEVLLNGMLALAYLDDGNDHMYQIFWQMFMADIERMRNALLTVRTETYTPIRDRFWD